MFVPAANVRLTANCRLFSDSRDAPLARPVPRNSSDAARAPGYLNQLNRRLGALRCIGFRLLLFLETVMEERRTEDHRDGNEKGENSIQEQLLQRDRSLRPPRRGSSQSKQFG